MYEVAIVDSPLCYTTRMHVCACPQELKLSALIQRVCIRSTSAACYKEIKLDTELVYRESRNVGKESMGILNSA